MKRTRTRMEDNSVYNNGTIVTHSQIGDSEPKVEEKHIKKKNKKRRLRSPEGTERPLNTPLIGTLHEGEEPVEVELTKKSDQRELPQELEGNPWRNLDLILLIQNKEINLQKKVESVFNFVVSGVKERGSKTNQDHETVKISRLIVVVGDWVQSLLISSEKKARPNGENSQDLVTNPCLDYKCWRIFKFCMEESLNFSVSLNLSRNLLSAICFIARNALSQVKNTSLSSKELLFNSEEWKFYNIVLDCVSLIFSSHGGLSNVNLDLWLSTITTVLEFVLLIYADNLDGGDVGVFSLKFSCLLLEPFTKFLCSKQTRKDGFRSFVDKLLEPLLHLFGVLHLKTDGSNLGLPGHFLKLLEEVLSHGLFHSMHIDGFLCLNGTRKYLTSHDEQSDPSVFIKSYHRHLFSRWETIIAEKKELAMCAIGELFHVLIDRVKDLRKASVFPKDTKMIREMGGSRNLEDVKSSNTSRALSGNTTVVENGQLRSLNAEVRKPLFDFFVQIMEPLLETGGCINDKSEVGPALLNAHCLLKSINSLLATFMNERVYLRTEDYSEGACLNFFKKVHDTIMSISTELMLSKDDVKSNADLEVLISVLKEVLVAVEYFLEIEYEVTGNDLVGLWHMILSYSAITFSFIDVPGQSLLSSKVLDLACRLVNLYSQLRQVSSITFALCKAMRVVILHEVEGEMHCAKFMTSSWSNACGNSVRMLLSSHDFRIAIHGAVKSIPEGQASGFIRQLTEDISETLEGIKISSSGCDNDKLNLRRLLQRYNLQTELLGRGLSEMYALVLESLTATPGNSYQIGASIEDLVLLIRPSLSVLVGSQPDSAKVFLTSVTGKTLFDSMMVGDESNMVEFVPSYWIFVFFFRVYMSCRSLYRQAISLMPPDSSRKMSARMGDSFTAYSAQDWMERSDWVDEGYFFWIVQPSASVFTVVQSVSNIYIRDSTIDSYPLIYVLHSMAIQRLVDLNRRIKSLEYLQQSDDNLMQVKVIVDDDLSMFRQRRKKCKRLISVQRQEAVGLTEFVMAHLSLVAKGKTSTCPSEDANSDNISTHTLHGTGIWDFSICDLDKKSFPTAIWWIVCQNVDIWSVHATKKKLKMFLSFLISTSHTCFARSDKDDAMLNINEISWQKKITIEQISSALLSDPTLYEQRFVRRHFASRFCRFLENIALQWFGDVDLSSLPNWTEVLSSLEYATGRASGNKDVPYDKFSQVIEISHPSDVPHKKKFKMRNSSPPSSAKVTTCEHLLSLLCWMPKGYTSSRSLTLYLTYILNLERILVNALLDRDSISYSLNQYELFKLLVFSRKTLKYLVMASCDDVGEDRLIPLLSESQFPLSWLCESVSMVVGIQEDSLKDSSSKVKEIIFSLVDHTSYVYLTVSKYQFVHAMQTLVNSDQEQSLDSSHSIEAWKSAIIVAKRLMEKTEGLLVSLENNDERVGVGIDIVSVNKFCSLASCVNGFLWGLASTLDHNYEMNGSHRAKLINLKWEPVFQINLCTDAFAKLIDVFLQMLLHKYDPECQSLSDYKSIQKLPCNTDCLATEQCLVKCSGSEVDVCPTEQRMSGSAMTCSPSSYIDDCCDNSSKERKKLFLKNLNNVSIVLNEANSVKLPCLNKPFLRGLLKGEYPEVAFSLKHLFIASSAMLRLNLQIKTAPLSSSLVHILIGISQDLILELASMVDSPHPFSFVWLDGVLKYLEELGNHFSLTDPVKSRNLYAKFIELHLRAIGRCISMQGKRSTLASRGMESVTKTLHGGVGSCEASPLGLYCLDEFKSRLRMSFKMFIKRASELHFLSAIQAIERALVGVKEGCTVIYEVNTGSKDGGNVSPTVAAGVDCLDLVLEFVSGRKRLPVVKRHIQSLVAGLFSIISHLQSPTIFQWKLIHKISNVDPDPGSVILMCVEVLARVSAKHALYEMDAGHVAQCLRIPAALFDEFCQLKLSEVPIQSESSVIPDKQISEPIASSNIILIDRQYSVDLFAACCRLLYSVLRHHKSECVRSIALLEASVRVLLHSLERVDTGALNLKGYITWEVEEAVKCASSLRRIYEEIRQQKEIVGRHCSQFLSYYISVYAGYGPLKAGIKREVDEALRPGIYALIDVCSADDLQYLHTVFGEGPCRNTLAALQHDYKQKFQYEGKV